MARRNCDFGVAVSSAIHSFQFYFVGVDATSAIILS
jgi:hypothetical protein